MTAIDCILIGIVMIILGFTFSVMGSLITKKFSTQDKIINFGGYMVGAGIVIAVLAWIYWIGMLLM